MFGTILSRGGTRVALLVLVLLLSLTGFASAHDYWMQLEGGTPPDQRMLNLWVGDSVVLAEKDEFDLRLIKRFEQITASGNTDLRPALKKNLEREVSLPSNGGGEQLVVMDRSGMRITLPGWKFRTYLEEEGFLGALKARKDAGQEWEPARERYSRFLKLYLPSSPGGTGKLFKQIVGQRYEIVALADPTQLAEDGLLPLRLLLDGRAAPNERVVAKHRDGGEVEGRSDEDGRLMIRLNGPGDWVVRSVHMGPCVGCPGADWESLWASYSFTVDALN